MMAKSKTIIFLVTFILKPPFSIIIALRAEIPIPNQFSITPSVISHFSFAIFGKKGN
jgi:hypothetical protein